MYRKLMFLISFVALLGLGNVAAGDTAKWACVGTDWCDPLNWGVADVNRVPNENDAVSIECDGAHVVIDNGCEAVCGQLNGPSGDNSLVQILGGSLYIHENGENGRWQNFGGDTAKIEITGGTVELDGRMRTGDYVNLLIGGDAEVTFNNYLRAEQDCDITITDHARVIVKGEYFRFSDEGVGNVTIGELGNPDSDPFVHCINSRFRMGDEGGSEDYCTMTINSGTVYCERPDDDPRDDAGEIKLGDDSPSTYIQNGGSVTLDTLLNFESRDNDCWFKMTGGELFCGELQLDNYAEGTTTYADISGGIINAGKFLVPSGADSDECLAVMNMTGGLVVVREVFRVGVNGTGTVQFDGGVIQAEDFVLENGTMDITEGVLIINGNKAAAISAMVCETGNLTGYGGPQGVVIDYDVTNPGKTTVSATEDFDRCRAYCPVPGNGAERVQSIETPVELCWQPGLCIGKRGRHGVYFDGDYEAVRDANDNPNIPPGRGFQRASLTCYNVTEDFGPLPLWTTYYWRIDEHNEDGSYTKGKVWSFTTGCEDILGDINKDCLLNFEDYASIAGTWQQEQLWP